MLDPRAATPHPVPLLLGGVLPLLIALQKTKERTHTRTHTHRGVIVAERVLEMNRRNGYAESRLDEARQTESNPQQSDASDRD